MFDEPPQPSPFPHGPNPPKKPDEGNSGGGGGALPPGAGGAMRPQAVSASARVPDHVTAGAMATGILIVPGQQEFILDFVQAMAKPVLVARVVVAAPVLEQIHSVMQENFSRYVATFGQPMAMPKPRPEDRPKSLQEIYDEVKVSDEMLSGVYANGAMVGHTPAEFHLDFLTNFMPRVAVSSRVYVAAPRMLGMIEAIGNTVSQIRKARQGQGPPMPPTASPPAPPAQNPTPPV